MEFKDLSKLALYLNQKFQDKSDLVRKGFLNESLPIVEYRRLFTRGQDLEAFRRFRDESTGEIVIVEQCL